MFSGAQERDTDFLTLPCTRAELARRGQWSDALEAYRIACGVLPERRAHVVEITGTRARRYAEHVGGLRGEVPPFAVSQTNRWLRFLLDPDAAPGPDEAPELRALRLLARDDVAGAAGLLRDANSRDVLLTALIGLRPGAPPDFADRMLSLPPRDLGGPLLPSLLAFTLRAHADATAVIEALGDDYERADVDALVAALRAPDLAAHPERIEAVARAQTLVDRGAVLAAGVVALGDVAFACWRDEARTLVFVNERPF